MTTDTHHVGQYLLQETIERLRGRDSEYAVGDDPSDLYFVSNLSPNASQDDRDEFDAKTKPSSIGLQVQPAEQNGDITIEFELYVPSVPDYQEFINIQEQRIRAAKIDAIDQVEDADSWTEVPLDEVNTTGLYTLEEVFYRRVSVTYSTELDLTTPRDESSRITAELQRTVNDTVTEFADDHHISEDNIGSYLSDDQDISDLSKTTFETARESVDQLQVDRLPWELNVNIETDKEEVTVTLENHSQVGDNDNLPGDQFVFNPMIRYSGSLSPYTFDLLPSDYRYDQTIWAKGKKCSTTVESDSDPHTVRTTAVPTSPIYEFVFNNDYDTDFDQLSSGDTIDTLETIAAGMREYYNEWTGQRRKTVRDDFDLTPAELEEYDKAAERFKAEVDRYEHGVDILRSESDVLEAFELMNEVNARQHDFSGWRLFQLVFIVSNLSGIVNREYDQHETEYDERADVLWFPTGGGKTEAYVGLVVFNLFFDRLRGKAQGVTAWIRFPLRLLSRQQKTRFLTSLLYAEELRQASGEQGLDSTGEPFSLGFFAGSHDTPNAIGTDRDTFREMFKKDHEKLKRNCKVLEECPLCESPVTVEYDSTQNKVIHQCEGPQCLGKLPLYVVDRDIYRYVPSVLLGSLDKIAIMGMQPRFANLLGNYTTECPVHGYGYSGRCSEYQLCEHESEVKEVDPDEAYDPIPTLHLIDEVHLLNEELGTFASHYETLYQTLCEQIGGKTPKIIASTATIAEYERQIENLFQKDATRFPAAGPLQGETFYGELTETVEREYHGFTPRNRSQMYAVLDTIIDYHQVIRDAYEMEPDELAESAGLDTLSDTQQEDILDLYETSLIYFNAKDRKDRYRENITKYANDQMTNNGYPTPIREQQLTADTESPELLNKLENPGDTSFKDRVDTVPATSFIGHGIDVDRFNMMLFYGYPRQTFQYIQASSRVGRQSGVVGFVLNIFDPLNERDDHRYRYFEKIHEYLDRTVEPVPIDRWAKFGIERTFTGLLQAILIQYYRPLMYRQYEINIDNDTEKANVQKAEHLHKMMTADTAFPELTQDKMGTIVADAFGINNDYFTNPYFRSEVDRRMDNVWNYWEKKLPTMSYPRFPDGEEPMISLRDIGDQGSITPDYDNQPFIDHLTGRGD
jgi:hypothetical protein